MAIPTIYNRVKMTVSGTPGTGVITLGSAVSGFQSFAGAGVPNATLVPYVIEDTGGAWEVGQGTYATSGTTLTRTTVVASSNAGSAISATSSAIVYISALAADLVYDTAATANRLAMRDANGISAFANVLEGYATTATAAGTTTLTVASAYQQFFTGSTTQTVAMPVASTLTLGQSWLIVNNSTGAVTVQSSGANNIVILAPGTCAVVTCILTSGTSAASWAVVYSGISIATGKALTISNSLTLAGTDATTMTFPGTSSTVLTTGNSATLAAGFGVTPYNLGTVSSGTVTPAVANGNFQYMTNNGAHTIAAPSTNCAIDIDVTNGASAGVITFSGFTVGSNTGDTYATTNANKYILMIRRINGTPTYAWKAYQ